MRIADVDCTACEGPAVAWDYTEIEWDKPEDIELWKKLKETSAYEIYIGECLFCGSWDVYFLDKLPEDHIVTKEWVERTRNIIGDELNWVLIDEEVD